jgi:hypothetical protein
MRLAIAAASLAYLLACPASAQDTRQLGPHVHGASHLTVAVEGRTLQMELHAPGADIVGFEYAPSTDQQRAAVAAATATLRDPVGLFGIPAAAGCSLTKAEVKLAEEDEDEHDQPPAGAGALGPTAAAPVAPAPSTPAAPMHTEFQVAYQLTCNNLAAITALNLAFFARFPNAATLDIDLITARGAFSLEATKAAPAVSTRNMF